MDSMIQEYEAAVAKRASFRERSALGHPVKLVTLPEHTAFADDADDLRIVDGVVYSGGEVWNALTRRGGV